MSNFNLQELMNKAVEITASGLPFMEGKENLKVDGAVLNAKLTVDEYGYLEGDDGEYVVIVLKEYPDKFIYGSSVVTDAFKKLDTKFTDEEINFLISQGLTMKLTKIQSKKNANRIYTGIKFFPED